MQINATLDLTAQQKQSIIELWNQEYPASLKLSGTDDFDNYLKPLKELKHYLLVNHENQIHGWALTFIRDQEKWFALIVNGKVQGKGYGRMLLNRLKSGEIHLSGWVIDQNIYKKENGTYYQSPLVFYLKNDFVVFPGIVLRTDKMNATKITWTRTL